jgi:cell division protein ZapA
MAKADIEVNGRRYSVACAPGQEVRLGTLGARLDRQVRQIADAVGDIGEARLLLVAALSLMDELDGSSPMADPVAIEAKAAAALTDAAARIDALASRFVRAEKI